MLEFRDLAAALQSSRVRRAIYDFQFQHFSQVVETSTYQIENEHTGGIVVVSLPPRQMELQTEMEVRVDGRAEAPVIPSAMIQEAVRTFLLNTGRTEQEITPLLVHLSGGQRRDHDSQLSDSELKPLLAVISAVAGNHPREAKALSKLIREVARGKYVPFVMLPSTLAPGAIVILQFRRRRSERVGRWEHLKALLVGRLRFKQRLPMGVRGHSTHLYVRPQSGTVLSMMRCPSSWPSGAVTVEGTPGLRHLYLTPKGKMAIWRHRELRKTEEKEKLATVDLAVPTAPRVSCIAALLIVALGSSLFAQHPSGTGGSGVPLTLFAIIGSLLLPQLLASREQGMVFRYLSTQVAVIAILGGAWFYASLGNNPWWLIPATVAWFAKDISLSYMGPFEAIIRSDWLQVTAKMTSRLKNAGRSFFFSPGASPSLGCPRYGYIPPLLRRSLHPWETLE